MWAGIQTWDDLESELEYGNSRSAAIYMGEVLTNAAADVAVGKDMMSI